jgi:RNA polymerase sigma-70 factor (ECF subfamily)
MTDKASALVPEEELTTHLPALRAFAISLTRNISAADDLVQETIVKAWSNLSRFEAGTNMRAWLFTILRNTHFSNRRKRKREVPDSDGMYARRLSVRPDHDGRLAFSEFLVAFDKLSDEHREVLVLVGASGFSYEEAAGMIGVAVGTVKSRANRARARLQELLGVSLGEDLVGTPTDHALMAAATAGSEGAG